MSTQPGRSSRSQPFILEKRSQVIPDVRQATGAEQTGDWKFSLSLQEGRVGIDKLLCLVT